MKKYVFAFLFFLVSVVIASVFDQWIDSVAIFALIGFLSGIGFLTFWKKHAQN